MRPSTPDELSTFLAGSGSSLSRLVGTLKAAPANKQNDTVVAQKMVHDRNSAPECTAECMQCASTNCVQKIIPTMLYMCTMLTTRTTHKTVRSTAHRFSCGSRTEQLQYALLLHFRLSLQTHPSLGFELSTYSLQAPSLRTNNATGKERVASLTSKVRWANP